MSKYKLDHVLVSVVSGWLISGGNHLGLFGPNSILAKTEAAYSFSHGKFVALFCSNGAVVGVFLNNLGKLSR